MTWDWGKHLLAFLALTLLAVVGQGCSNPYLAVGKQPDSRSAPQKNVVRIKLETGTPKRIAPSFGIGYVIVQLLGAERALVHSELVTTDVDGDGRGELVAFVIAVYPREGIYPNVKNWLVVLYSHQGEMAVQAKLEVDIATSSPHIRLQPLSGERGHAIILSSGKGQSHRSRHRAFRLETPDRIVPLRFVGGITQDLFRSDSLQGKLSFSSSVPTVATVSYGVGLTNHARYEWRRGKFNLIENTSITANQQQLEVIEAIDSRLSSEVSAVQFYDNSIALTYSEQGELTRYHLVRFAKSNHGVTLELLDSKSMSVQEIDRSHRPILRKHGLVEAQAQTYYLWGQSRRWLWSPKYGSVFL